MKHFAISTIHAILFVGIIAVFSAIFNESFESLAVYFLLGLVAGLVADKHTKEGR